MAHKRGGHIAPVDASLGAVAGHPAHDHARVAERDADGAHAEPMHQLVQQLFLMPGSHGRQVVMFSAMEANRGAAALCGHVAEALAAQVDDPVCVVDADLREPSMDQYFGVSPEAGLTDALRDGGAMRSCTKVKANLWFMPAGSPSSDPGLQFSSDRTHSVFDEIRHEFKYVLVYAAPIGECSESLVLSRWTDGVVLIVQAHRTLQSKALRVKTALDAARVPLLAVALTDVRPPVPDVLSRWF